MQLNLGFALIGTSLLIGGACAVSIYVGAESIFGIYTSDPETLKLLLPTRIICIPYIICSLCNSVTDGMVIAAQEFRAQALVYISAMVFVYLPFVIVVKEAESLKITLTTVYLAKLCFELTKLFGLGYLATIRTPRKMRAAREAREAQWDEDYRTAGQEMTAAADTIVADMVSTDYRRYR